MKKNFTKYLLILILLSLIPLVYLSKDNLVNMAFEAFSKKKISLIKSKNQIPEMSFDILNKDGSKFSTKEMLGKKYILHFFATWCGHCIEEYKEFMVLKNELPIYAVAWNDFPENIKDLVRILGNPYTEILIDQYGLESRDLQIQAIPLTFIINEEGKIIFVRRGRISPEELRYIFSKK